MRHPLPIARLAARLTVQVPRRTLAALGDADDVRTLEPYAEATIDAAQ